MNKFSITLLTVLPLFGTGASLRASEVPKKKLRVTFADNSSKTEQELSQAIRADDAAVLQENEKVHNTVSGEQSIEPIVAQAPVEKRLVPIRLYKPGKNRPVVKNANKKPSAPRRPYTIVGKNPPAFKKQPVINNADFRLDSDDENSKTIVAKPLTISPVESNPASVPNEVGQVPVINAQPVVNNADFRLDSDDENSKTIVAKPLTISPVESNPASAPNVVGQVPVINAQPVVNNADFRLDSDDENSKTIVAKPLTISPVESNPASAPNEVVQEPVINAQPVINNADFRLDSDDENSKNIVAKPLTINPVESNPASASNEMGKNNSVSPEPVIKASEEITQPAANTQDSKDTTSNVLSVEKIEVSQDNTLSIQQPVEEKLVFDFESDTHKIVEHTPPASVVSHDYIVPMIDSIVTAENDLALPEQATVEILGQAAAMPSEVQNHGLIQLVNVLNEQNPDNLMQRLQLIEPLIDQREYPIIKAKLNKVISALQNNTPLAEIRNSQDYKMLMNRVNCRVPELLAKHSAASQRAVPAARNVSPTVAAAAASRVSPIIPAALESHVLVQLLNSLDEQNSADLLQRLQAVESLIKPHQYPMIKARLNKVIDALQKNVPVAQIRNSQDYTLLNSRVNERVSELVAAQPHVQPSVAPQVSAPAAPRAARLKAMRARNAFNV